MATEQQAVRKFLYGAILEKIIGGEFAPGQRLVEEELAAAFGISRTPVREVLIALQKDGLVERVPNRGARVVSFTPDEVEDLYELRKALECHCVQKAARTIRLTELLELEHALAALDGGSGQEWRDEHMRIDLRLHWLIVHNSGNRRIIASMEKVSLLIESLQVASIRADVHVAETGVQHQAIIRALARRNGALAQHLLADHIEYGKRNTLELFVRLRKELPPEIVRPPLDMEGAFLRESGRGG